MFCFLGRQICAFESRRPNVG